MLLDQGAGGVEVVRGLQGEQLDALERALGEPDEGAGGRQLDDGGDAEVGEPLHAQVPAHRVRHLGRRGGRAPRGRR